MKFVIFFNLFIFYLPLMFCDFITEYIENINAFNITSLLISWSPIQLSAYNFYFLMKPGLFQGHMAICMKF